MTGGHKLTTRRLELLIRHNGATRADAGSGHGSGVAEREDAQDVYADAELYDVLYAGMDRGCNFYRELAARAGGPVLELGCGTGRLGLPIAEVGADYVGIDLSEAMIRRAGAKSQLAGVRASFVRDDMCSFALDRRFDLIFVGVESFMHLTELDRVEACLARVRQHLTPAGRFVLDVANPQPEAQRALAGRRQSIATFYDPAKADSVVVEKENVYDPVLQLSHMTWFITWTETREERRIPLTFKQYYPCELRAVLKYNGFEVVEEFGDFDRTPLRPGAPCHICVCRLRP
jgi:SAM-dependent methyltransferase